MNSDSFAGWNGAVFKDVDGSLGGGPNSYIVLDTGIAAAADDKDCRIEPTWGAAVCKGDLGRVTINAGGGGRGGAGGGAPAAGPGAAPAPGAAAAVPVRGPGAAGAAAGPGAAPAPGAARPLLVLLPDEALVAEEAVELSPIVLSRNGRNFTVTGATNVRAGTEIKAESTASPLSISLSELDMRLLGYF